MHFVAHHRLDGAAGVGGATLALGAALAARGCVVSYFSFDDAFGLAGGGEISRMVRFPWRVASHLSRTATNYDVVDATTGDAWLWASRRPRGVRPVLVTRAHGLEQVTTEDLRRRARAGELTLSRKYSLYHGGYRLWEVRRSLVGADAQIFLNEPDRDYAVQRLGVRAATASVLPNGVADRLLDLPRVEPATTTNPVALAFVGSWIPRKGTRAMVAMASELRSRGVAFTLRLLGTGASEADVLSAFAPEVRDRITVTPRYDPAELPALLHGAEVLLHASWTEGFSLALVEGMACGLAPVASRAGGATTVIRDGATGILLLDESGRLLADGVARLAGDRRTLGRLRVAAQASMQALRWDSIAARTIVTYRAALRAL